MDGNFEDELVKKFEELLKSDHWWMEISACDTTIISPFSLKSDHWWFEISTFLFLHGCFFFVKIRPLMDGNLQYLDILYQDHPLLKSDHWWMEMIIIYSSFFSLKSVKIRPLMDGNAIYLSSTTRIFKVKIRPLMDGNKEGIYESRKIRNDVKIRPLMDGNIYFRTLSIAFDSC